MRKFFLLGFVGFTILAAYWLMRVLKLAIFFKVAFPEQLGWAPEQGALLQPAAKTWTPFVVLCIVLAYSKLVDLVKKHQLFYIVCTIYATIFCAAAAVLWLRDLYGPVFLGKSTLAALGWVIFFAVESFGALVVSLFWSFISSITDTQSAERGYPLVFAIAQIGAIFGSSVVICSGSVGGLWPLMVLVVLLVSCVPLLIYYFMRTTPPHELVGNKIALQTERRHDGFLEGFFSGLKLLFTRPYLFAILIISTFDGIAMIILEYQMDKRAACSVYFNTEIGFCRFQGLVGFGSGLLAFFVVLLGTSRIIKLLGFRLSLFVYPIIFGSLFSLLLAVFWVDFFSSDQLMWLFFGAILILKAISYAFNNPLKEMMYIPTSKDVKFKSKGWIDTFGSRFTKAAGAQITGFYKHNLAELMLFGSLVSLGLIGFWLLAALYVGLKHRWLIKNEAIVE